MRATGRRLALAASIRTDEAGRMIEVQVVRVFADERGGFGNELGIVTGDERTRGQEQRIAAELGFSETVFIDGVSNGVCRLRIFTPAAELPFAGHPSVGTAWWLAREGEPVHTLAERAGDVAVRADGDLTWVAALADWAPEFEWMPLPAPADVDSLDPSAFGGGHHYAHAWIDEGSGILRSRMFAPELGIAEDEATGAAAVRVTALLRRDLDIRQGLGSRIRTRLLPGGLVEVGGRTVYDRAIALRTATATS